LTSRLAVDGIQLLTPDNTRTTTLDAEARAELRDAVACSACCADGR
jgi:hypothetical protein